MIDLSYHREPEPKDPEPEEIVMAILAIVMWVVIILGCMGAF